jgi:hypothetical protein
MASERRTDDMIQVVLAALDSAESYREDNEIWQTVAMDADNM